MQLHQLIGQLEAIRKERGGHLVVVIDSSGEEVRGVEVAEDTLALDESDLYFVKIRETR